jgi:hypothetical protein
MPFCGFSADSTFQVSLRDNRGGLLCCLEEQTRQLSTTGDTLRLPVDCIDISL